jgi:hypothetical protein
VGFEVLGVVAHGDVECRSRLDLAGDRSHDVLELLALRLPARQEQRIHERHARLDHGGELLEEIEDVVALDPLVDLGRDAGVRE